MNVFENTVPLSMVALLGGVLFSSVLFSGGMYGVIFAGVAFTALVFGVFTKNRRYYLIAVVTGALALGIIRCVFWQNTPDDPLLVSVAGTNATFWGTVIDEPDQRENNTRLTVRIDSADKKETKQGAIRGVLLVTDRFPEFQYGDRIQFSGTLEYPKVFAEDDGRSFDYPAYLRTKGIGFELFRPTIVQTADEKGGNMLTGILLSVKHEFLEKLAQVLPEPENALAGGILLGERRSLGIEWTERFRTAGIIHIIVLSGYNMTIVAEWLGKIFLFLGFTGSIIVSSVGIILFALLAGGGATVIRAAIMAIIALLARLTGRTSSAGRALLIAATGMVMWNPGILAHDPSFQLSFLASLGLIYCSPIVERFVPKGVKFRTVRETIVATLATQLFVLPLLVYSTGILSVVSLGANLAVLPIIPFTMLCAFLAGMFGFLGPILAFIPGVVAHTALAYILMVGKFSAALPFAALHIPAFEAWIVGATYLILGLSMYFLWYRKPCPVAQDLSVKNIDRTEIRQ